MAGKIVGLDGRPASEPERQYKIDEFGFTTKAKPEDAYRQAIGQVRQMLAQAGQPMTSAQPFRFEPGAQAMFMGVALEFERIHERLDKLEAMHVKDVIAAHDQGDG
jgi:hypothetical protein